MKQGDEMNIVNAKNEIIEKFLFNISNCFLNIKEFKIIDLKEVYNITFTELVSKIYRKDILNLDFMNSLTKIYFKFFLKKLLERDTLILNALTM